MSKWVYNHLWASKVHGGVPQEAGPKLLEAVEDFVNGLGPKPDGIQCIMSEGSTTRDFHCWVRADHTQNRYDLTHIIWTSNDANATVDAVIGFLENGAILVGFDGGNTQSIYYFRKIN